MICYEAVMNFSNLISALNPALGEAYRRERYHSGTTGKRRNCKAPERLVGISTGSYGSSRSRSAPDWSIRNCRLPVLRARCWVGIEFMCIESSCIHGFLPPAALRPSGLKCLSRRISKTSCGALNLNAFRNRGWQDSPLILWCMDRNKANACNQA
jgi:hypothetical protein